MSRSDLTTIRKARTDDRPVWDVVLGLYDYPTVLLAHKLKLLLLGKRKRRSGPCNVLPRIERCYV